MPLSMYQVSVPIFHQLLESLSAVLDKAEADCRTSGNEPADMLALRLLEWVRKHKEARGW